MTPVHRRFSKSVIKIKGQAMGWGVIIIGLFSIGGAALNIDLFMESRKAQVFVNLFGHNGARLFYVLFGVAAVVIGVLILMGIIVDKPH
jgi:hypothetical protein